MSTQTGAWIDERTGVITYAGTLTDKQARELEPIIRDAFNAGLTRGYQQGLFRRDDA